MNRKIYLFFAIIILICGCGKDFLETKSTSDIDRSQIFETTSSAMTALNGIHRIMYEQGSTAPQGGFGVYMLWMDMMGEDLVYTKSNAQWKTAANWTLHRNTSSTIYVKYLYSFFYRIIANANVIIAQIDNVDGPKSEKDYIKGQALTYRAFSHFCLVQLWAERYAEGKQNTQDGIVLRLDGGLDPKERSNVEDVYSSINKDLVDALALLVNIKIERTTKTHINYYVTKGIQARVLLTQGKWLEAANAAKEVVEKSGAKLQADTYEKKQGRMCDASNNEWIWAKIGQPALETGNLTNFFSYISNTNISYNKNTPRAIYNLLYNKISTTDVRKSLWLPDAPKLAKSDIVYPPSGNIFLWMSQKYIVDYPDNTSSSYSASMNTADLPYMRLPEMILIMAEGYARAGKDDLASDALYPLALIRDSKYVKSSNTGNSLIDEIMIQRRVELWGEGFRFTDLKRLNMDLDRGPAPRSGYNQGGASNNWKNGKMPTNLDPLASNYNMYDDQPIGEENRYKKAGDIVWQFVFPQSELDYNPLCKQNPL